MQILTQLNWGGVLVGAVLAYLFGAFWFSPRAFGDAWLAALGKTRDQIEMTLLPMLMQAIYTLLLAVFIALLYQLLDNWFCVIVGLLMLLQFIGIYCGALFQDQDRRMPLITGGYSVAQVVIIAAAVWFI